MKIKEQILRQEIINFVESSIIYKSLIDQLVMNEFDENSKYCFCEIQKEYHQHISDCYDTHMGEELLNRTHLLKEFCDKYYQFLIDLVKQGEIEVYEDDVFYSGFNDELLSFVSEYLRCRHTIIENYEEIISEMIYEVMYLELREENQTEKVEG